MNYEKLFLKMKEKNLTTYKIMKEKIVSQGAMTALRSGGSVTIRTIEALCRALDCEPGDIMEMDKPKK